MRIEDNNPPALDSANAARSKQLRELRAASQQFESLFINMLLSAMRKAIPRSGFLDGGLQEEVFQTMFDNTIAEKMAARGNGLGIGDMLYNNLAPRIIGRGGTT